MFYIYGGGRWREVDIETGKIDGWGQARFLVSRRRKLNIVRTEPVLTALRALADGKPSAARDGLQLHFKHPKYKDTKNLKESLNNCENCHCVPHSNGGIFGNLKPNIVQTAQKVDSVTQTVTNELGKKRKFNNASEDSGKKRKKDSSELKKRKRETSSSDSDSISSGKSIQKKLVVAATVHRTNSIRANSVLKSQSFKPRKVLITPTKSPKASASSSDIKLAVVSPKRRCLSFLKPSSNGLDFGPRKHKQSTSIEQSAVNSLKRGFNKPNYERPDKQSKVASDESDFTNESSDDSHKFIKKQGPVDTSLKKSSYNLKKELIIEEQDVAILRLFIQKNGTDEDLLKFDMDDEYKKLQFYRITPLVQIEQCAQIARMLSGSQESRIPLTEFVSKLGLQSVTEVSSQPRYKIRKRKEKVDEKENLKPNVKDGDGNRKKAEVIMLSRKEDSVKKQVQKPIVKKPKAIPTKRRVLNEYSNLEDHAIVSWVSTGGRAVSVNGNRLWKQFQEQYPQLTGQVRTWHSLRNRYLRYILPRLGTLALPPWHQARLRAAAATGEIKGHKRTTKRNSMFELPKVGAASRTRRVVLDRTIEDSEENEQGPLTRSQRATASVINPPTTSTPTKVHSSKASPKHRAPRTARAPTPRYSDVIRQFTQKHLSRQHSSDTSNRSSKARKSNESDGDKSHGSNSARESDRRRNKSARNKSVESNRDNSDMSQSDSESDRRENKTVRNKSNELKKDSLGESQSDSESDRRENKTVRNKSNELKKDSLGESQSDSESDRRENKTVRNKSNKLKKDRSDDSHSDRVSDRRENKLTRNKFIESNRNKSKVLLGSESDRRKSNRNSLKTVEKSHTSKTERSRKKNDSRRNNATVAESDSDSDFIVESRDQSVASDTDGSKRTKNRRQSNRKQSLKRSSVREKGERKLTMNRNSVRNQSANESSRNHAGSSGNISNNNVSNKNSKESNRHTSKKDIKPNVSKSKIDKVDEPAIESSTLPKRKSIGHKSILISDGDSDAFETQRVSKLKTNRNKSISESESESSDDSLNKRRSNRISRNNSNSLDEAGKSLRKSNRLSLNKSATRETRISPAKKISNENGNRNTISKEHNRSKVKDLENKSRNGPFQNQRRTRRLFNPKAAI